jgi:hypothetical protein
MIDGHEGEERINGLVHDVTSSSGGGSLPASGEIGIGLSPQLRRPSNCLSRDSRLNEQQLSTLAGFLQGRQPQGAGGCRT